MSLRSSSMADAYLRGIIVVILWCSSAGDGDTYFLCFRQKKNVKIVSPTTHRPIQRLLPPPVVSFATYPCRMARA